MKRSALAPLLWGMGLGAIILGVGGRFSMRLIAEATTGTSSFSVGGTMTVVFLGVVSGALGALILLAARALLRRWSPAPTILYWAALLRKAA